MSCKACARVAESAKSRGASREFVFVIFPPPSKAREAAFDERGFADFPLRGGYWNSFRINWAFWFAIESD
jgi:hypothetical protein